MIPCAPNGLKTYPRRIIYFLFRLIFCSCLMFLLSSLSVLTVSTLFHSFNCFLNCCTMPSEDLFLLSLLFKLCPL